MATEYDDNGNEVDDGSDIPGLRKYAKDQERIAKDAQAKLAEYERREALRSAGLNDLTEVQLKAISAVTEGEQSPDTLRRTAESLGFVQPKEVVPAEVQQGHERVAEAAQTAQTQAKTSKDDEYMSAKTPEEVIAIAQKHGSPTTWDMTR